MSQKLRPYPAYKDSGVPWLGKVPAHWQRLPIRAFAQVKNERGRPDLPLLSVYRDYGVIQRDSRDDNYNPQGDDLSSYKVVEPGDLVLNKMKTWQGSLGVSAHLGIVSPAYIVCRLSEQTNRRYLHIVLRSRPYVNCYNQLSFGVRVNQWDMRYQDFKQIPVFFSSHQ
jgi:type I restriction enzyme S subunit